MNYLYSWTRHSSCWFSLFSASSTDTTQASSAFSSKTNSTSSLSLTELKRTSNAHNKTSRTSEQRARLSYYRLIKLHLLVKICPLALTVSRTRTVVGLRSSLRHSKPPEIPSTMQEITQLRSKQTWSTKWYRSGANFARMKLRWQFLTRSEQWTQCQIQNNCATQSWKARRCQKPSTIKNT